MKKHTLWILSALTVMLTAGCFGDDMHDKMYGNQNSFRLRANIGLEMGNVAGFTLVPEGEAASTSPYQKAASGDCLLSTNTTETPDGSCTKLYALTATGGVLPVALADAIEVGNDDNDGGDDGSGGGNYGPGNSQTLTPDTIYNVGNFVFFVYPMGLTTQYGSCGMVVLQKSDGALYCSLDTVITCQQTDACHGFPTDMLVQANGDGTFVHAVGGNVGLLQLDFADPVSAVSRILFDPTDGFLRYFRSNENGDVLSIVGPTGSNKIDLRLYKRSGGFVNLPAFSTGMQGESPCIFPGLGGDSDNFYVVTPGSGYGGTTFPADLQNKITRVGLASGQVTTETYAHDTTGGLSLGWCFGQNTSQASTLDRHFIGFPPPPGQIGENQFTEVYNPTGIPERRTISEFKSITKMYGCTDQLILRGRDAQENDMIARYYPETVSTSVVINSVDYSITAVAVSDSCEISFGGRRASDNSRILGNIPVDTNEVTVYSNNLPGDVKALVRIK